ncbi:MAG: hypothetical protein ACRDLU_00875 [Gaiellaceae bacterium]
MRHRPGIEVAGVFSLVFGLFCSGIVLGTVVASFVGEEFAEARQMELEMKRRERERVEESD